MTDPATRPPGPARRLPTMKDVADHLGVSRQLVSLVLRGADGPSAESRERILAAARELGYRPNASARLLRQSSTRTLGIAFSLGNAFQVKVVERLIAAAGERGYRMALAPIHAGRGTDEAVGSLMEQRVEALAVFNPEPGSEALAAARGVVPVLQLGEWSADATQDTVHVDEATGLRLAVEHLVGLGHEAIAFVGGRGEEPGPARARAYEDAMRQAGLGERIDVVPSDLGEEEGAAAARTVLARAVRPTALVCVSDHAAAGVLAVLARAGVAVPGEISVVGFDDSRIAALSFHDLTSVHQDVGATVEAALGVLLERLGVGSDGADAADGADAGDGAGRSDLAEGAARVIATPAHLVVRGSTGPAHSRG